MPVDDRHRNRNGRVNGGAFMAFADAMGAVGTIANLPRGALTTTLESKTNFFAAGAGPDDTWRIEAAAYRRAAPMCGRRR